MTNRVLSSWCLFVIASSACTADEKTVEDEPVVEEEPIVDEEPIVEEEPFSLDGYKAREVNDDPVALHVAQRPDYIFNIPASGPDPLQHDECRDQYTPEADARMDRLFDVRDYGARGTGQSATIGDGVVASEECEHCAASVGNGGLRALADTLTFPERTYTQVSSEDSTVTRQYTKPFGLEADDEWDWIGIQSALTAAQQAGGGTVVIPDTGHDYLLNRDLWIGTNTRLIWQTSTGETHSALALTGPTGVGGFISNINSYELKYIAGVADLNDPARIIAKQAGYFACKVRIHDPRVKADIGENGIAFAKGAYGIQIYGGRIERATWGTAADFIQGYGEQGGRGLQFESGVQQVRVVGTRLVNVSLGVSVSAGLYAAVRNNDWIYLNAGDRVELVDLDFENAELPFFVAHNLGQRLHGLERDALLVTSPQSVVIEGFTARNSGHLVVVSKAPYPDQPRAEQVGIINLHGATNVTVRARDGEPNYVTNDTHNGSLIRGFGSHIAISDIVMQGSTRALVDHHCPFGRLAIAPKVSDFEVSNIEHRGGAGSLVRMHSPMFVNAAGSSIYLNLVTDVAYRGLRTDVSPGNNFGEHASLFQSPYLTPPNLILEHSML